MKKQLRILTVATCLLAAALAAGQTAFAGYGQGAGPGAMHGEHHKGGPGGGFLNRVAEELKMSAEQKAKAKEVFEQSRGEHRPLMEAMRAEKSGLKKLVASGNADEAAIRAQAAKVAAVQADLAVAKGEAAKRLVAILTPEQKTKLKELQEKGKGPFAGGGRRCGNMW